MSYIFLPKQMVFGAVRTSYASLTRCKSIFKYALSPQCGLFCQRYSGYARTKLKNSLIVGLPSVLLAAPLVQVNDDEESSKKSKKEEDSEMVLMIKHAILSQMKDEGDKAEMYLHKALKLADREYSQNKLSRVEYLNAKVYIYDILANNAFTRQDFEKAEVLYKETMKGYLESGKEKTDNAMVEISLKLATIYAMQQRDLEAIKGYEFCIKTQKEKLANDSKNNEDTIGFLGMALEGYGRYLLYKKQLSLSLTMLTESLDIAKSLLGENAEQTLVLMNDLATVYLLNQDFQKAGDILQSAIQIAEKSNSNISATLYSNLGAVHLGRADISETESACKKSLLMATRNSDQYAMKQANECLNKVKELRKGSK